MTAKRLFLIAPKPFGRLLQRGEPREPLAELTSWERWCLAGELVSCPTNRPASRQRPPVSVEEPGQDAPRRRAGKEARWLDWSSCSRVIRRELPERIRPRARTGSSKLLSISHFTGSGLMGGAGFVFMRVNLRRVGHARALSSPSAGCAGKLTRLPKIFLASRPPFAQSPGVNFAGPPANHESKDHHHPEESRA